MSKGPGRVQSAIAALIARDPDNAWSYSDLCRLIYGQATRANKSAVGRALKTMALPGTWTYRRTHHRVRWLFDGYNPASLRQAYRGGGAFTAGLVEQTIRERMAPIDKRSSVAGLLGER